MTKHVPVGESFRSNCMRRWEGKGRKRGRKGEESRMRDNLVSPFRRSYSV